jgi:hypothetical protein
MVKAATLIGSGFIASALGSVCAFAGSAANTAEIVTLTAPTQPGTAWVVIGLILAGAGVIALAWGFVKLATTVEYLANVAEFFVKEEKAQREARREAS